MHEEEVRKVKNGESSGSEILSKGIGFKEVEQEVMGVLNKMKGVNSIRIGWYCSGIVEI